MLLVLVIRRGEQGGYAVSVQLLVLEISLKFIVNSVICASVIMG